MTATVKRGKKLGISINGQEPIVWFDDAGIPFFGPAGENVMYTVSNGQFIGLSLNGREPSDWWPNEYPFGRMILHQAHAFTGFSPKYIIVSY